MWYFEVSKKSLLAQRKGNREVDRWIKQDLYVHDFTHYLALVLFSPFTCKKLIYSFTLSLQVCKTAEDLQHMTQCSRHNQARIKRLAKTLSKQCCQIHYKKLFCNAKPNSTSFFPKIGTVRIIMFFFWSLEAHTSNSVTISWYYLLAKWFNSNLSSMWYHAIQADELVFGLQYTTLKRTWSIVLDSKTSWSW